MSVQTANFLESNLQVVPGASLTQVRATAQDVEQWISHLPLLDLSRSSQQLLTLLNDLAVADIDDQLRLDILEVMRKPLRSITQSLSKHFFVQKIQLDQLADRIFDLNSEFKALQSQIYFHIAQRLTEKLQTSNFGLLAINKKKNLQNQIGLAIHRGITELTQLLFDHQMLYRVSPTKLWARVHYLYMLACRLELQGNAFFDTQLKFSRKSTINQAYNGAILLSLFNTGRLRQNDITTIFDLIESWASLVVITEMPTPKTMMMVNPFTDMAPNYLSKDSTIGNRYFYFDFSEVSDYLNSSKFLDKTSLTYETESLLSSNMLKYVRDLIATPLERASKRHKVDNETLEVFFGLSIIHDQLTGTTFKEFSQGVGLDATTTISTVGYEISASGHFENNLIEPNKQPDNFAYQCQVENISTGGIGLRWAQSEEIKALKTGELVLYREVINKQWTLGIVRWLRRHPDLSIEFGVQTLSAEVLPCVISIRPKNQPMSEYLRGFVLTDNEQKLTPTSFVTQPYPYKPSHVVTITLASQESEIEMGNLVLESNSFVQYLFQPTGESRQLTDGIYPTVKSETKTMTTSDSKKQFDDLWGNL